MGRTMGRIHRLFQFIKASDLILFYKIRQSHRTRLSGLQALSPRFFAKSKNSAATSFSPYPGQYHSPGFTLLECLISLSLSLLILVSALEISTRARHVFFRLKETQEASLATAVALEKIREDLETAGAGIPVLPDGEPFSPLQASAGNLIIFSAEGRTRLLAGAVAGQDFLLIELLPGLSSKWRKGRALYLFDGFSGQLTYITAVSGNRLSISPALAFSFAADRSQLILLEKIEIYPDLQQKTLRRKVNDTSGQPLLEEVLSFGANYTPAENLVVVRLTAASGVKSRDYELVLYPKNLRKI
ncbi:MAG: prepilin-type N-terminal cleavage/methylation domain-containing protein [Candidatus Saccharicenans sp.]|uniref:prepilin-type N-terminal cleavage/methylation domain-containing protein n=1 Tax=Candidatus Saccharicenans sp. TaxID=2819258 RepID=UPI0040496C2C